MTISTPLLDGPKGPALFGYDDLDAHSGDYAAEAGSHRQAHSYAPTNGFAIISLVLAIVWLGGLGSLLAVIFGFTAKRQMVQRNEGGQGMALAGIVLGMVGVLVVVAIFITVPSLRDVAGELLP